MVVSDSNARVNVLLRVAVSSVSVSGWIPMMYDKPRNWFRSLLVCISTGRDRKEMKSCGNLLVSVGGRTRASRMAEGVGYGREDARFVVEVEDRLKVEFEAASGLREG